MNDPTADAWKIVEWIASDADEGASAPVGFTQRRGRWVASVRDGSDPPCVAISSYSDDAEAHEAFAAITTASA
jgi:hypothetical protein